MLHQTSGEQFWQPSRVPAACRGLQNLSARNCGDSFSCLVMLALITAAECIPWPAPAREELKVYLGYYNQNPLYCVSQRAFCCIWAGFPIFGRGFALKDRTGTQNALRVNCVLTLLSAQQQTRARHWAWCQSSSIKIVSNIHWLCSRLLNYAID
jgi:hypothetical protein